MTKLPERNVLDGSKAPKTTTGELQEALIAIRDSCPSCSEMTVPPRKREEKSGESAWKMSEKEAYRWKRWRMLRWKRLRQGT